MELLTIYEDNHLLAVNKPAGLLVQSDRSGDDSLLDLARAHLKTKYAKPGNVFVGLVHRLDRNVSGVVLLARTSKAASRLAAQFREGQVGKTYLAVAQGAPPAKSGLLTAHFSAKGDTRGVTRAQTVPFKGSREGILEYEVLESASGRFLVRVELMTGRRHQIRAQLALVGCPLLGDVKYGSEVRLADHRVALHARRLVVNHPVGGRAMDFICEPPVDWPWPHGGS